MTHIILIMQEDGNLVLYRLTGSRDQGQVRAPIWASHTNGHKGSHLEVQDDGIAVIYTPDHTVIWSSW